MDPVSRVVLRITKGPFGYIVCDSGGGLELSLRPWEKSDRTFPRKGLLVSGSFATVFKTRDAAKRAIARSRRYEEQHGLFWQTEAWTVQRLHVA